jgi:secondary thiamine-phosphate synthase enzyme
VARLLACYVPSVPVHTSEIQLSTRGHSDIVDITRRVQDAVTESGAADGIASAFVRGSTAAITTMEFEPGGVTDLRNLLDRLIPVRGDYEHNRLNHDTNSHAHQRASIVGASEVVPVEGGRLALGTWQQLVLIDFDDRARERTVVIQVVA